MSRPNLYLDEDTMRKSLFFGLRARNVDVITAAEVKRSDEDHLVTASASGRVLYTFNVTDYRVLHQKWVARKRFHACIVVARQQRYAVGEELRRLMRLIGHVTAYQMQNRIEFLSSWA